jgi:hypothetical protein
LSPAYFVLVVRRPLASAMAERKWVLRHVNTSDMIDN